MAKLNVDEIEASGTNSNVKVVTKGTDGSCEIKAATNDATLQLNCSAQSHGVKLKAPSNTAGQNYTMILPNNQIAANEYISVKNVTGSGVNGVGQLEFGTQDPDLSSLNANLFTSGTIPDANYTIPGSKGGGLQLIQKQTIDANDTYQSISFTNLEDGGMYRIIGKNILFSNTTYTRMKWLKADGTAYNNLTYTRYDDNDDAMTFSASANQSSLALFPGHNYERHRFEIELSTKTPSGTDQQTNWLLAFAHTLGTDDHKCELYAWFDGANTTDRIHGIQFLPYSSSRYFEIGTEILLYKYNVN